MSILQMSLYKLRKYRCLQQITYLKAVSMHILYRNAWCVWNPSSLFITCPGLGSAQPFLFSSSLLSLKNTTARKLDLCEGTVPSNNAKVNKGKLSQSIISVTSALIGALVMNGFITITQVFCSDPCLCSWASFLLWLLLPSTSCL